MIQDPDPRLTLPAIRERYNNPVWFGLIDKWHQFTAKTIFHEVTKALNILRDDSSDRVILNVGAGANDFGLRSPSMISLDISETRISGMPNPVVANAELLPIPDNTVNLIICVGSVINYCDVAAVIAELGRVVCHNGSLILEFESSYSAELITQSAFRQSAAVAETFYADRSEAIWVYSPEYIHNLLKAANFKILRSIPIHVLSPWLLLLLRNPNIAAAISSVDRLATSFPFLSRWASNHLIFCEKQI